MMKITRVGLRSAMVLVSRVRRQVHGTLIVVVLSGAPWGASGLGLRIPNQDAEAIARGNAFAATADNPSAIYYNPAGIGQLEGHNVSVGVLNYLGITSTYTAPNGHESETDWEYTPVPQFFYTYGREDKPLAFGLGVYAPFGLGLEWPVDTGFRTLAIEGRVTYLTANPVLAWKINPTLTIAAGPTFNFSRAELRQGIGIPGGHPADQFRFKGTDVGFGFNAGLLWQPCTQWSFGFNYRSATRINYDGDTELSPYAPETATTAEMDYPQIISGGVSYRPTPDWNLEVNVDWTDWNTLDTVVFEGAPGGGIPFPLNWRGSWFYEVGVTRRLSNDWFVSAGYFFSSNSTSEQNFTPYVPDTDLHTGSIGFGQRHDRWSWAVSGQIITGPERTVDEANPNPISGESPNGTYQFFIPAVTFTLGYRF